MAQTNRKCVLLLLLLCLTLLTFHPLPVQAADKQPEAIESENSAPLALHSVETEGLAAYYASRYNGRKTNSGERYRMEKLTAAHADLPLGTRVKVVNLANGRQVIVTINDRCRKKSFPFIDVSRAAAKILGFFGKGTTRVKIIALGAEGDDES
jgi:peptidoglycan lytic transglycosylase